MTPDLGTRRRLLDTATRLFAQHGFNNVGVRELCDAADANVAAVNYHFRNKYGLYLAVIELAVGVMRAVDAEARQAGEGRPAEEQLRLYVQVFLRRLAAIGRDNWINQLIRHELSEPTAALDVFIEKGFRPRFEYLGGIVATLIGCPVEDPRVMKCITSIQSQFLMLVPSPALTRVYAKVGRTPPTLDDVADHIADFSLAGIRALTHQGRTHRVSGRRATPTRRRKLSV